MATWVVLGCIDRASFPAGHGIILAIVWDILLSLQMQLGSRLSTSIDYVSDKTRNCYTHTSGLHLNYTMIPLVSYSIRSYTK